MALSRFWVALFLCSIGYLLVVLFTGRYYSIEFAVNGKKDDPLLQRETYLEQLPPEVQQSLQSAADHKVTIGREQYVFDSGVVKVYAGKQAADLGRNRPAQIRSAQGHRGHGTALQMRRQPAQGGFDFG